MIHRYQSQPWQVLVLDMNSTFMFGEDRFGPEQHYAQQYCGDLAAEQVNNAVTAAIDWLAVRYPDPQWREQFPTVAQALRQTSPALSPANIERLTDLIAQHEMGEVPLAYREAIAALAQRYTLALYVDIWAPADRWRQYLTDIGVLKHFSAIRFSSDHGHVKPSPWGLQSMLAELACEPANALSIGDSIRRDIGSAEAAGVATVLLCEQPAQQYHGSWAETLLQATKVLLEA